MKWSLQKTKLEKIICYILENVNYKRKIEEENSHVILLKFDKVFAVKNVVSHYRTFQIEENETTLSQAKKQLKSITNFILFFENISTGSAQQVCNKLDHALGKVVDFLTQIVTKTVWINRFEPSYVTKEKKKLKWLHKKAKKKKCPILIKKCHSLLRKIKIMVRKSKCEKIRNEVNFETTCRKQ